MCIAVIAVSQVSDTYYSWVPWQSIHQPSSIAPSFPFLPSPSFPFGHSQQKASAEWLSVKWSRHESEGAMVAVAGALDRGGAY
jgi:hypothetical protein